MTRTNQHRSGAKHTAFSFWTMLTALAICGGFALTWLFLLVLSWLKS
jgi:hypothetical protein